MSLTQVWLGNDFSNWRVSTLGDTGMVCQLSVVCTNFRLHTERSPRARIRLRTLWRPIVTPCVHSEVRSLRLP